MPMKKHFRNLLLLVVTNLLLPPPLWADTMSPYSVNFDTTINTDDHNFKVATGWGHIPESYNANDGYYGTETYWVKYSFRSSDGVDGSGCIYADSQNIGYTATDWGESDDKKNVNDLLVTPAAYGNVSLMVKSKNTTTSSIKFYKVDDNNVVDKANPILEVSASELSTSKYNEVTFSLDTPTKVGIRASEVYIDNFSAATAEIILAKAMTIASVSADYYSYDFVEQPDGTVKYTNPSTKEEGFRVSVKNSGDIALDENDENYSVVLADANGNMLGTPTKVPETLQVGETSSKFLMSAQFSPGDFWKSATNPTIYVKENITGTLQKIGVAYFKAYEAKFTFRDYNGSGSSSLKDTQALGLISANSSKDYEIYNSGTAPLRIQSIAMTEGFTTNPSESFEVAPGEKQVVSITMPSTPGSYNSTLTIQYLLKNNGEVMTYTLPITANVLKDGTWSANFNNTSSSVVYPEGAVAENGINSDSRYISTGNYDCWLKSYSSSDYKDGNNKFITPKLIAEAGESMTFDVAYDKDGSEHFVKVYLSTDRIHWGEPVAETLLTSDNTTFETKSFTVENAGEYYVGFAIFGAKLDNIAGFKKADMPAHDLYESKFEIESRKIDANGNVYNGEVEYTTAIIPLIGQTKTDYTLEFCMESANGIEKTEVTPVALAQSAKSTVNIKVKHTSAYETTTDVKAYFVFTFTDGTTIKTPEHEFTVSVEPDFIFIKSEFYPSYRPEKNESTPLAFGKLNQPAVNKEYAIANWGSAPLTVTSITVPEGFSLGATEATVAPKDRFVIEVTFNPATSGTYSGTLDITYLDGAGKQQSYSLPVSGTMLDSSKWFASFDDAQNSTTGEWPGGIVHDDGVQLYNAGSYAKPNMGVITYSADKWISTPPLTAAAGEQLLISAMSNRSYNFPSLKVYASETREGLSKEESRTELLTINELPYNTLTDYSVTIEEAGTYYFGIQLGAYAVIADIYGLALPEDTHEIDIVGSSIPATMMQNVASMAQLQLRNYGVAPETDYKIIVHVGDDSYVVDAPAEIPMNHTVKAASSDATTEISLPLRWPETGTFPVYLEFKSGNYSKATEPVEVTFTEELPTGEAIVGTPSGFSTDVPVKYNYRNSETVMLFTADELGLANGTKISGLSIKGYSSADSKTTVLKVYYAFTDETTVAQPAAGNLDVTGLTNVIDETHTWAEKGTQNAPVDQLAVNFAEPLVYESGKSLKLVVCSYMPYQGSGYARNISFEKSSDNANCYMAYSDTQATADNDRGNITNSWSKYNRPVLHINYALDPVKVNGTVTDAGNTAVEGAVVTFISEDGDNVRYTATTDASGRYTLNVVQNDRVYTAQAVKDNLMDFQLGVTADATQALDFVVGTAVVLDDNANITEAATGATVMVDLRREAGFNALVFPMAVTLDEIADIFGTDAEVFEFQGMVEGDDATAWFKPSDATSFAAGTPILVNSGNVSEKLVMRNKDIVKDVTPVVKDGVTFTGTFAPATMQTGMFHVNSENWNEYVEDAPASTSYMERAAAVSETIRPFTAVIQTPKAIPALSFVTTNNRPTGVEDVIVDGNNDEAVIYNLQGIRVKNPTTGIYIVNGKKTYIHK